jgi:hypothetical protein
MRRVPPIAEQQLGRRPVCCCCCFRQHLESSSAVSESHHALVDLEKAPVVNPGSMGVSRPQNTICHIQAVRKRGELEPSPLSQLQCRARFIAPVSAAAAAAQARCSSSGSQTTSAPPPTSPFLNWAVPTTPQQSCWSRASCGSARAPCGGRRLAPAAVWDRSCRGPRQQQQELLRSSKGAWQQHNWLAACSTHRHQARPPTLLVATRAGRASSQPVVRQRQRGRSARLPQQPLPKQRHPQQPAAAAHHTASSSPGPTWWTCCAPGG